MSEMNAPQYETRKKDEQKQRVLLENAIQQLEQEIDEKYYQLGRSIYELADRKFEEIDQMVDRLVEIKLTLSHLKGHRICTHCLTQNPIENNYCGKCGKTIEREEENEQRE